MLEISYITYQVDIMILMLKEAKDSIDSFQNTTRVKIAKSIFPITTFLIFIVSLMLIESILVIFSIAFTYIFGGLISILINPQIMIAYNPNSILKLIQYTTWNNWVILGIANVLIVGSLIIWTKGTYKLDYIRETGIVNAMIRQINENLDIKKMDLLIYASLILIVTIFIKFSGKIAFQYQDGIVLLISAFLLNFYSNAGKELLIIQSRKAIFSLFITINLIFNMAISSYDSLISMGEITLIIIAFYLLIDQFISVLIEYRKKIIDGIDLSCTLNCLTDSDLKTMYFKLIKSDIETLTDIEISTLLFCSLRFNEKLSNDYIEKAISTLKKNGIHIDNRNPMLVFLANYYFAFSNLEVDKIQDMYKEAHEVQKKSEFKGIRFNDLESLIGLCETYKEEPNYELALTYLKKGSSSSNYLLSIAECYFHLGNFDESERIFRLFDYNNVLNMSATYYLIRLELNKFNPDVSFIDECESILKMNGHELDDEYCLLKTAHNTMISDIPFL